MTQRNFTNTSTVGALTGPIAASAVSAIVSNFSNPPATPFTVTIDRNTPSEEICLVTAIAGTTFTVVRGYDGTAGQAHSAGAAFEHTAGAIEYAEANAHNNATSNVHGITGAVVGDQGAQTIYDKTLVSPVLQADTTKGDAVVAYTPPGTSAKNLYSGKGTDGTTKFTVDSSGNVTGAGVSLTALNTTVAGHTTSIAAKADKTYVDSQDTATLNSAKSYTNGKLAAPTIISLTPNSGWTGSTFGGFVDLSGVKHLTGWFSNVNTFTPGGGEVIITLPQALWPTGPRFFALPVSSGQLTIQVNITTSGVMNIARPATATIGSGAVWETSVCTYL